MCDNEVTSTKVCRYIGDSPLPLLAHAEADPLEVSNGLTLYVLLKTYLAATLILGPLKKTFTVAGRVATGVPVSLTMITVMMMTPGKYAECATIKQQDITSTLSHVKVAKASSGND